MGARQSCSLAVGSRRPLSQMSVCLAFRDSVTILSWACLVAGSCQPSMVGNFWLSWVDCAKVLAPPPPGVCAPSSLNPLETGWSEQSVQSLGGLREG